MTPQERETLRAKINEAKRAMTRIVCPVTRKSLNYSYKSLGCRCSSCVAHQTAERQRRRRGELRGVAQPKKEHGVGAYKSGRCRCSVCRELANAARRARWRRARGLAA